jgi:hypothetical protein
MDNQIVRPSFDELPDVLESKDLSKILPYADSYIRTLLTQGTIPSRRWGRKHLILKKDLLEFLHNLK